MHDDRRFQWCHRSDRVPSPPVHRTTAVFHCLRDRTHPQLPWGSRHPEALAAATAPEAAEPAAAAGEVPVKLEVEKAPSMLDTIGKWVSSRFGGEGEGAGDVLPFTTSAYSERTSGGRRPSVHTHGVTNSAWAKVDGKWVQGGARPEHGIRRQSSQGAASAA